MNYREVKCSDRLPEERTEVHIINNGLLSSGFVQDGQWYLGEHETPVISFSGVWLEPYELPTEPKVEDIARIIANTVLVVSENGELFCEPNSMIDAAKAITNLFVQ